MTGQVVECAGTLDDLAHGINQEHEAAQHAFGSALAHAIEAGRLLIVAKASLKHGEWLAWLEKNTAVSKRTARVYMQLSRNSAKLEANRQHVANLSIREAVASISSQHQRIARLPAEVVDKAVKECADDQRLKETLAQAESHQRYREEEARRQAMPEPVTAVLLGPPRELTKADIMLMSAVMSAIEDTYREYPYLEPLMVRDVFDRLEGMEEVWPPISEAWRSCRP